MLNPMKLKDYVTLGNILGGLASMVAAMHGNLDWACYFMVIAWLFDSLDGAVARLTGGGNKFGMVLDNTADLVAYSLAPSFVVYLAYTTERSAGGAGWPIWAAFALASLPTIFGCVRFARNDVKEIILPRYHLGLPRTVYGLYIASLFTSHLFRNPWIADPTSALNPVLYAMGAIFIAATSFLTFTLRPYYAKPKRGQGTRKFIIFCGFWLLTTSALGLIIGLLIGQPRLLIDSLLFNFTCYVWFQHLAIPAHQMREVKQYVERLAREWKEEMG